ncbi:T9SS type A sorting domain-containing protein [Flavobacteriales bacterium]|nr:T9SS type A sorting domain-containing protein [Flavobacteriales bacterium]
MKHYIFILLFLTSLNALSQIEKKYDNSSDKLPNWVQLMYTDKPNVGNVIEEYENYYKTNSFNKNKHTQYYKRWIRSFSRETIEVKISNNKSSNNWEGIGPWDFDINAESRSYAPGAAHLYTVEQSKSNNNVLYAGAATAGAWRSNNKGDNWFHITKDFHLSSVYAIEIDFQDEDIIYISGNGGLHKSIDGGINWNSVGGSNFNSQSHSIKDIKMHSLNNQIIFVASNNGLYKSIDGGITLNEIMSGDFQEIEFHPSSPDTMYFIKQDANFTEFYRSNDNGDNLTLFTNGWPSPSANDEQKRTEIAVSGAAPNKIVALATGSANGGSGLYGIYISYDKGENWTFRCCGSQPAGVPSANNINMMGWQPSGLDDGGQYYYDLALAVNPNDANIIHVGGVNHWISFDDGQTFSCPAKWSEPHKKGYVHADIHDINYFGNDLWFACDGGVFYSDNFGDSIYKKMYGIEGTDFWGFGAGFKNGDVMLGGTYHNGTLLKDNNTYINDWLCTDGGDNYRGFVNFGNPRIAYSDYGGKNLSGDRNVPIASFSIEKKPNASYIIGQSSQIEFDPRCYNWMYSGNDTTLWLSKNNGASFEAVYHFDANVASVEVAWSNPDFIYVSTYPGWWDKKYLYKSEDAGQSWIDITPTLSDEWITYDITISSNDENTIWISRNSMYGSYPNYDGEKVYKSTDGGLNWVNLTTNTLDDVFPTNIEHQRGSDGGIYLGTRNAVYYRNNTMPDWVIYDNNLPKPTISTQLIPFYRKGQLFNGTNRSAYQIDLFEDTPPSAQISADKTNINCMNDTVYFVDHSAVRASNATWNWSFPGGSPSTSNLEDPIIIYNQAGSYDVSLTVTDQFGTSSQTLSNFIKYDDTTSAITSSTNYKQDFESIIFPPTAWQTPNSSFSWQSIIVDTGSNCLPNKVTYVDHYHISQRGDEAFLISNKVKLGNGPSAINYLTYDYSYSGFSSAHDDGFRIDISNDCGHNWDSIYGAFGADLATTSYQSSVWFPTCDSWQTDTINLSSLGYNNDTIMLRFVAINDYGNQFYLDNININGDNIVTNKNIKNYSLRLYPNPSKGIFSVLSNYHNLDYEIYDLMGKSIKKGKIFKNEKTINLAAEKPGIYLAVFKSSYNTITKKFTIY